MKAIVVTDQAAGTIVTERRHGLSDDVRMILLTLGYDRRERCRSDGTCKIAQHPHGARSRCRFAFGAAEPRRTPRQPRTSDKVRELGLKAIIHNL